MFQLDILGLIPQSLKQTVRDVLVDFVADQAKKYTSDELAAKIKKLRSDASFNKTFDQGLQQAAQRFVEEYKVEDEDLVATIAADKEFFKNEEIQKALLAVLKKPSAYLDDERDILFQSFDTVLPQRLNRERVNRAVKYLLRCLAEELWHMPELQPVYSLQFQRVTAEATREQVAIQKAQLQALTGLNTGIREALLQLTDAIAEKKALPAGDTLAFPMPPKPRVYHNLPQPDYGHFVGRDKELAKVARILRPYPHSQEHLVTIDGIGGIGKSTLALEVAHRYLRNYDRIPSEERFDAIIWTSAKQTVLTAEGIITRRQALRTLDDIYTAIAVALQREDITRARPEEQAEVVRQALIRQRTLIIVDNLETLDDKDVLTFLRELPAPTKAIVTTRHRLDVAYPVRLVEMPWEDSQQLIAQESKKKSVTLSVDLARQLYDRTSGVPLAIVWSIAQMGFGYSVEVVLTRLGKPSSDIARFCFERALQYIRGKPAQRLLVALALFAVDANRETLGFVANLPELDRDDGLSELEKLSLINKPDARFKLLPLTKSFVLAETVPYKDDLQQNWLNWATEFIRSLGAGSEVELAARFNQIDLENENILAILAYAYENKEWTAIIRISRIMGWYWYARGKWTEQRYWLEKTIEASNFIQQERDLSPDETSLMGVNYNCYGWMLLGQSEYEKGEAAMQKGLALSETVGNKSGQAFNLRNLGVLEFERKNWDASRIYYQKALKIWQELDNSREIASCHTRLGQLFDAQKEHEAAKDLIWRGLQVHIDMEDEDRIGAAWIRLADAYYNLAEYDEAEKYYYEGRKPRKSFETYQNFVKARIGLAKIAEKRGEFTSAIQHAQQALEQADKLGMTQEASVAYQILQRLASN